MVSYLFLSVFLAIIGLAAVVTFLAVALPRARKRRELDRRKREIGSPGELEDFIRQVDQATTDEQIDRLGNERGEG